MPIQSNLLAWVKSSGTLKNDWVQKTLEEVVESSGAENKLEENKETVSRFSPRPAWRDCLFIKVFSLHDSLSTWARSLIVIHKLQISAGIPHRLNPCGVWVCDPPRKRLYLWSTCPIFEKGLLLFGTVEQLEPFPIYSLRKLRKTQEAAFAQNENWLKEEQNDQG